MNQPPLRLPFLEPSSAGMGVHTVCLCKVLQVDVLQCQLHNVEQGIWVRPPWEVGGRRLGTQGPKYSRTITTRVLAPGSQEVDFLSQFCKVPSPPPILSFTSVSRGLGFNSRCGAFHRHNNCQFEALENQAIRTQQCAARASI